MNQDQLKEKLLEIDGDVDDFTLILSGKKSTKANGIYNPETKEIVIHNKNFSTENELIYTAIHEFAHHLQYTKSTMPVTSRAHTNSFWNIFHQLLGDAEEKGIYQNIFVQDSEFVKLTKKIKQNFVFTNGVLMKDFGKMLMEAFELCRKKNASFEDYISRELLLNRSAVKSIMKISTMDVDPKVGYENMKILSNIKDDEERKSLEQEFIEGKTPDMVKAELKEKKTKDVSPIDFLFKEKNKIERTIQNLTKKLEDLENQIKKVSEQES